MEKIKKHPFVYSILLSEIIGLILCMFYYGNSLKYVNDFITGIITAFGVGIFYIYPILLTILNLCFLFWKTKDFKLQKIGKNFEYITILLGFLYSTLVLFIFSIQFQADWPEVLYNDEVHTPLWTASYPTVICFAIVGVTGYLLLSFIHLNNMPPLVVVISISAMYLGILECSLWIAQILSEKYFILCLFPFNCIIIAAKTIRYKIMEWNKMQLISSKTSKNKFLKFLNQKLMNSYTWPIAAFLFMWPLLGILIAIFALFGQQPDSVVKAWTETSDWRLSQRVAPQNIYRDGHYLCTVAAGGHEKVVKPIRLGVRHGHKVIVNRQLCIANAFEQILEERTPVFHKHLRHFYDTYGFPIAKVIHSPYMADLIYFVMKPLEWLFLMVLYFCDVNPENRIAIQYLPKRRDIDERSNQIHPSI